MNKRDGRHYALQALPGIGPARAARLVEHFGSVRAAINATSEELAELNGIGKATADRMDWAVRNQGTIYGDSATAFPRRAG